MFYNTFQIFIPWSCEKLFLFIHTKKERKKVERNVSSLENCENNTRGAVEASPHFFNLKEKNVDLKIRRGSSETKRKN